MSAFLLTVIMLSACAGNDDTQKEEETKIEKTDTEQNNRQEANNGEEKSSDQEKTVLKDEILVQTLDSHLENGMVESQIYRALDGLLEAEPDIGEDEAFSFVIIGPVFDQNDEVAFLIAGINRLPHAIKNLYLNFSLSTPDGEYIWKEDNIRLADTDSSSIEENRMIPIVIEMTTEKQTNQIEEASFEYDYSEFNLEVNDLSFDKVNK